MNLATVQHRRRGRSVKERDPVRRASDLAARSPVRATLSGIVSTLLAISVAGAGLEGTGMLVGPGSTRSQLARVGASKSRRARRWGAAMRRVDRRREVDLPLFRRVLPGGGRPADPGPWARLRVVPEVPLPDRHRCRARTGLGLLLQHPALRGASRSRGGRESALRSRRGPRLDPTRGSRGAGRAAPLLHAARDGAGRVRQWRDRGLRRRRQPGSDHDRSRVTALRRRLLLPGHGQERLPRRTAGHGLVRRPPLRAGLRAPRARPVAGRRQHAPRPARAPGGRVVGGAGVLPCAGGERRRNLHPALPRP